jgi:hypothetical protein
MISETNDEDQPPPYRDSEISEISDKSEKKHFLDKNNTVVPIVQMSINTVPVSNNNNTYYCIKTYYCIEDCKEATNDCKEATKESIKDCCCHPASKISILVVTVFLMILLIFSTKTLYTESYINPKCNIAEDNCSQATCLVNAYNNRIIVCNEDKECFKNSEQECIDSKDCSDISTFCEGPIESEIHNKWKLEYEATYYKKFKSIPFKNMYESDRHGDSISNILTLWGSTAMVSVAILFVKAFADSVSSI